VVLARHPPHVLAEAGPSGGPTTTRQLISFPIFLSYEPFQQYLKAKYVSRDDRIQEILTGTLHESVMLE
jgi:hypothetical protein